MNLDEIRLVAEELRAAFADERRAIAALDAERLEWLADHKRRCCARLEELVAGNTSPVIRRLLTGVRAEAEANAALAAIAADAVRGALGTTSTGTYDRHARTVTRSGPIRIIATY